MITARTRMKLPYVIWPIDSENDRFGGGFGGVSTVIGAEPDSIPLQYTLYRPSGGTCLRGPEQPVFHDGLATAGRLAGIVMAATPRTTPAKPIQAVRLRLSPSKATLMATPIG